MIYYRIKDGTDIHKKPKFKILDTNNKKVTDKKILEYIKSLVIPPAYNNVNIFYEKTPKILFQGTDDKGRLQQIYSLNHKKKAMKKKFCNLLEFGKVLPKIKLDIEKHVNNTTFTKNKIISIILKIVMICGFRLGNMKYQKIYNSFGISNILKSHIVNKNNMMFIKFIGKKGVVNECCITNKNIILALNKRIAGKTSKDYVFTYIDEFSDVEKTITALDINKFLKTYGDNITSKMFRTYDTNVLFIEYMKNRSNVDDPTTITLIKRKKIVIEAMKIISNQINNTPAIAKKEYLHIDLLTLYLDNPKKFKKYFFKCNNSHKCFIDYLEEYCKKKLN
jgi:DNA topoisomerase-1